MIRNSFSILNGIGEKLEKRLWGEGILAWEDFIGTDAVDFISPDRKKLFDGALSASLTELAGGNSKYFTTTLKRNDHWRLFDAFRGEAVCLDIETNGYAPGGGGYVTMVGLYDGFDYKCLINGNGLTPENLRREVSGYKYLITFFGSAFDVPFLSATMRGGFNPDIPHFDLCFAARKVGLRGGLKKVEVQLGISRDEAVRGMDGYAAVLLWERARRGSTQALELLVQYNKEDTVNLMRIAETVYSRLRSATGIDGFKKPIKSD